jgi:hypothetical protein
MCNFELGLSGRLRRHQQRKWLTTRHLFKEAFKIFPDTKLRKIRKEVSTGIRRSDGRMGSGGEESTDVIIIIK